MLGTVSGRSRQAIGARQLPLIVCKAAYLVRHRHHTKWLSPGIRGYFTEAIEVVQTAIRGASHLLRSCTLLDVTLGGK